MSENLEESKQLSAYVEEPAIGTEKELIKTNLGLQERKREEREPPRPPDYISEEHSACAWIANRNPAGEVIKLNVKIGDFYFKLRKRFL
jgi:hypothetical protein